MAISLEPTPVNRAARICRLYGLQVWAVQPAYVGYINTTVPNRLLSCQIQVIIL